MAAKGKRGPGRKPAGGSRRAPSRLRESAEQFRLAQEALGIVTWIWDLPQNRVQWHGNVAYMLGLKPGSFSGRFQEYLRHVHPDDLARAKATFVDCLKGRTPEYRSEERVVWPDGSERWLETYGRASYGRDGRAVRMTGVIKDITPRKIQESSLLRAQQMFGALFSSNPEPIVITRLRDARILEVNAAWERGSGYRRMEAIGRSAIDLRSWIEPADRDAMISLLERRGIASNIETRLLRADGKVIDVLLSAARVVIDGEACAIWSWRDVSDLHEAERRARLSEHKFTALFENSPEAISLMRISDGMRLTANAAWERYTGYPRDRASGQPATKMSMFRDPAVRAALIARVDAEGSISNVDVRLVRADGSDRDGLISAVAIELEGERCILWNWRDVTAEREVERLATQAQRKLAALFETSPVALLVTRPNERRIVEINDAALRLFGISRNEAIGADTDDVIRATDRPRREQLRDRMVAGEKMNGLPIRFSTRAGRQVEGLMSVALVELEGEPHLVLSMLDITEQHRIEREAQQSLQKFATLFRTNPVGIVISKVGAGEAITEVNDAALRMMGATREEVIGATSSQVVEWLDKEEREAARARVRAGEYVTDVPLRFRRRDGVVVEGIFSGGLVEIDGEASMVLSLRDLTDQRRVERERQTADARYRSLFESSVDGMYILQPDGMVLDVNPALCRLLGYTREEFIGQSAAKFLDPKELRRLPIRTDATKRWGRVERVMPRKGGAEGVAMEIVAGPMPDGNILGILRDITERKRNETLLMNVARGVSAAVGDAFFRSLVQHLARELEADFTFIGELGADLRVRTLAYVADGAIAPNFDYPLESSPSANAIAERGTVIFDKGVAELFPLNPGLRERGVQGYVATALFGAGGEPLGVLVVMSRRPIERSGFWASMTEIFGARAAAEIERSRADQLVRQMNASLEQRVRERTAELEEANRDLDSYNFSVSHDLRQPLNAIAGFSELLRENLAGGAADEALEYTREIETNATRMEQMIAALLGFSRAGRGALQSAQVDMRAQVDSVLRDLSVAAPLRAQVAVGDLPPAQGDATLLRQVWSNLIGNALKYSARAEAPRIVIAGVRRNGAIEYSVRDNGVGFDMRHADRLFGVFQRLPSSAGFEGTGVGLAIVQRIVRRHGGHISGESSPGQGTVIRFSLPQ